MYGYCSSTITLFIWELVWLAGNGFCSIHVPALSLKPKIYLFYANLPPPTVKVWTLLRKLSPRFLKKKKKKLPPLKCNHKLVHEFVEKFRRNATTWNTVWIRSTVQHAWIIRHMSYPLHLFLKRSEFTHLVSH